MSEELHRLTLRQQIDGLAQKRFSAVELTQAYLDRIAQLDNRLNSFITVTADAALQQASLADQRRSQGEAGPLTGIPLAQKDIFCTTGVKTTCGSRMLDNFVPPYNAAVIEKCNAAGLVTLGKTNMDEFAMGSSNESSWYKPCHNPWDLNRVPGGSSGGSAAAIAGDLAPLATGTDTGGSIRQPAAFCGLTGLKPTYGLISRWGMIAYASSLDQAGPMGRSAFDCAALLNVLAGHDARDSTSVSRPEQDYTAALDRPVAGLRIGIPRQYFASGLDPVIQERVMQALKVLEGQGATLVEIDLKCADLAIPAYYLIAPAEASSNLSRFDGVRFGHRCDDPADLMDLYTRSRAEGFGEEVQRRILIGTYALSAGYYDAYYLKALRVRRLIQQDFQQAFSQCDVIAGPTTPGVAYPLAATHDPVSMYLGDIYTIAVNLAGLPALSLPCGFDDSTGARLPAGMQLIGNYWQEEQLLNTAHIYQQQTDWHNQRSPVALEETQS